jgi:integrase
MVWTPVQTQAFLNHTARHRLSALFVLLAYTGCRRGLRWEDIDLITGEAAIHCQLLRIGTQTLQGAPKTDAGIRTLALARPVMKALSDHRRTLAVERSAVGAAWTETHLVFTRPDGSALNPAAVSDLFDRLIHEAGRGRSIRQGMLEKGQSQIGGQRFAGGSEDPGAQTDGHRPRYCHGTTRGQAGWPSL